TFRLLDVPAGTHQVVASKGEFKVRSEASVGGDSPVADLKSLLIRRTGSITGVVKVNGAGGLLGTDVFVPGSTLIAKCKDNGAFALIGVAEGTYHVAVARAGAAPMIQDAVVKAGKNTQLDFALKA